MGDIKESISKNIAFYRKKANLTQSQVATALSVKTTTVSTWERGASVPDIETLYNLCKLLGVSLEDISEIGSSPILSITEQRLLSDFSKLNGKGQLKVLEDTHNLTLLSAYTEGFKEPEPDYLMPKAAHERTDIDVTEDMRRHDDDIMNNF